MVTKSSGLISSWGLVLLLVLLGCPEPDPGPLPDPADGVDPAVRAAEGESRAGRVRPGIEGEAALFGGVASEGKSGDFMIYNRLVQFVIQDAYRSHGYVESGGNIIDADLVRAPGVPGRDPLDDFFLSFGLVWLFHADSVAVTADGSDGGPARITARGSWVLWDFIQGAVEETEPLLPQTTFAIVNEYELAPESFSLKVTSRFTNEGFEEVQINPATGYLASQEDLWAWASGQGLNPEELDGVEAIGGVGRLGEATLSVWPESGTLPLLALANLVSSAGISATSFGWTDVAPGDSIEMVRYVTLAPDTITAEAERHVVQGTPLAEVEGVVRDELGGPVDGVRVHFVEADSTSELPWIAGFATTGADGRFEAALPPGDWDVYAVGREPDEIVDLPSGAGRYGPFTVPSVNETQLEILRGNASADPLPLAKGYTTQPPVRVAAEPGVPEELELTVLRGGTLAIDVADGSGDPVPAYVEISWSGGAAPDSNVPASLRSALGVPTSSSRAARVWTPDGRVDVPLLAGTYDVAVEHSWRHGRAVIEGVQVGSGEVQTVAAVLEEQIARDGWLGMDSHLHAAPSNDGTLAMEDRLVACAATGVDLPVTTDHDRMADYRPLATALGLDSRFQVIPGVEVSPVLRGHFNLFPVEPRPQTLLNGGAESWWFIPENQDELFERIYASGSGTSLLQVNHGRGGMMSFASYSPGTGEVSDPDLWSWDFELFELINATSRGDFAELREDYFSFLNQGYRKVPTGVSDSHGRSSPCGYGRTDVFLDTEDPSSVTPAQLQEALQAGHVIVAGGITLRASSGSSLPGDELVGESHELVASVRAPDWMRPEEVRLIRDGVLVSTVELPDEPEEGALWWEGSFVLEPEEDAWYVVEVEGSQALGGVWGGGVPYAITNAFFVDVGGDGWTPPGL